MNKPIHVHISTYKCVKYDHTRFMKTSIIGDMYDSFPVLQLDSNESAVSACRSYTGFLNSKSYFYHYFSS